MNEQVLIHEIKTSAESQDNAKLLLSPDKKRFYWNDKNFTNINIGDYVYIINPKGRLALFTTLAEKNIASIYDPSTRISSFQQYGHTYRIADPDHRFKGFVGFDILELQELPEGWSWRNALRKSEQLYLWTDNIEGAEKRISRLEDLKKVFAKDESNLFLSTVEKLLTDTLDKRNVWFVTQGKSYKEHWGKQFLWAPKQTETGKSKFFWGNVNKVKKGDIIFNYSDGLKAISIATSDAFDSTNPDGESSTWAKDGYSVNINLKELEHPVSIQQFREHKDQLSKLLQEVNNKPFQADGSANQGYLYEFTAGAGKYIRDNMYKQRFGDTVIDDFFDKTNLQLNAEPMSKATTRPPAEVINHVHAYIAAAGFQYKQEEIANFYLALKTKPFVILAGISGTGKSQLPRKFAAAIGMDRSQVIQMPVRPDWTDGSDLLGYTSLEGNFVPKDLTLAIQEAKNNPTKPYFFILDEMNLARVENYFSDFLSVIETREWAADRTITTVPILRKETLQKAKDAGDYGGYTWPQNLYLIGTVNMDETTHTFSRKVLDRANSIEMNDVNLDWDMNATKPVTPLKDIGNALLLTEYIEAIDLSTAEKNGLKSELDHLIAINTILETAGLHFAYRVRDEIMFYLTLNKKYKLMDDATALDFQIVQKILPRIHGSSERVQAVLVELLNHLEGFSFKSTGFEYEQQKNNIQIPSFKYKRSSSKIVFMLKRFEDDRFTSFWL